MKITVNDVVIENPIYLFIEIDTDPAGEEMGPFKILLCGGQLRVNKGGEAQSLLIDGDSIGGLLFPNGVTVTGTGDDTHPRILIEEDGYSGAQRPHIVPTKS